MEDRLLSKEDLADLFTENYLLKKCLEKILIECQSINLSIVCVGGPLNDNIKGYTPDQMKDFWKINDSTEFMIDEIENALGLKYDLE